MQRLLAFEELTAYQLGMMLWHRETQAEPSRPLECPTPIFEAFTARLPYNLTGAQTRVVSEIFHDLRQTSPALRLIQGS